jgi:hypothetical protein
MTPQVSAAAIDRSSNPFIEPVHVVAMAAKKAGKPHSWIAHAVRTGILDIEAKLNLLGDCAKSAAHYLMEEPERNVLALDGEPVGPRL